MTEKEYKDKHDKYDAKIKYYRQKIFDLEDKYHAQINKGKRDKIDDYLTRCAMGLSARGL